MLHTFLASPIVKGAIAGLVAAATVDLHAFMTWKSVSDVKTYNWSTAALRWFQGIVTGAITGAGLTLA